jgi:glucose/arabinose dehydrogenase
MRYATLALVLLAAVALILPWAVPATETKKPKALPAPRPFDTHRRVPWNTSRVVGSPNPPAPYRVQRAFPKLKLTSPIGVASEPGTKNLLLIVQSRPWSGRGTILRIPDREEVEKTETFLDIDGIAYGVAFHPDYRKNGLLFVGLNGPMKGDDKKTRVVRYTVDRKPPHRIVPGSAKVIIEWPSNGHNGGDLAFGNDGMLYVSSGDGTSDSDTNRTGQDLSKPLAKVLRIDVDHPEPGRTYSVPRDNPFVGQKNIRPETWAYGFRNPWRLHIDRRSGDLWVGNNGQDLWEQIFLVQKGANYGWSVMEGSHPFYPDRKAGPHPFSKPIAEHHHSEARSMTGGVVYHGNRLPELRGAYLYGDWSTGKIWGIRHRDGKVTWHQELTDSTLQITGFGLDSKGELLIADHGGGYYRLEPAPKETNRPKFPTRLSETGLFVSVKDHRPHPALVPYSVNAPLWSDGAHKERFLALPGLTQIDFTPNRGWNFPNGTVLVKTFSLEGEPGNSATRRRIETRLLTRQEGEWVGYSYLWDEAGTDATLVDGAGMDRKFVLHDARGGKRTQTWHFPSRTECMVCHSRAANFVLGPSTVQMNRRHDYGAGVVDNQLRILDRLGMFRTPQSDHIDMLKTRARSLGGAIVGGVNRPLVALRSLLPGTPEPVRRLQGDMLSLVSVPLDRLEKEAYRPLQWIEKAMRERGGTAPLLPKIPSEYGRLAEPSDRRQPLEARARAYLHANCAQCHVLAGGGNALMELEFNQPRDKMNVIGVRPQHHTFDIPGAKLIDPGHPERSLLYLRVSRRGQGQMPPLATAEVDREAVQILGDWIRSMK